ncbi:hypothetical protein SERLA73DRAFT_68302 [Serpula lacrymans var. lacrymans S7.3]|uniref:Uncharacterized protein n=1 Tax=Serpula lacrymans var. lacrymans (strain S7.3) TaxID=936435 RepID=F8PI37_SERL3|nr:hypothetical protein SERLA73DRAFT_68302 [Serpula lacrymans var. lacrymans S7.3]
MSPPLVSQPAPTVVLPVLLASDDLRKLIIEEWQDQMGFEQQEHFPCAVCSHSNVRASLLRVHASSIYLELLQNPCLPRATHPTTYDFQLYHRAFLDIRALKDVTHLGHLELCHSCHHSLVNYQKQPLDAIANFQYYAIPELPLLVSADWDNATLYDTSLVSRASATKLSHLFAHKKDSPLYGSNMCLSQKYIRGNVAVMPQDSVHLRTVLPPDGAEIANTMCALFVGWNVKPTRENVAVLWPVFVSKRRVHRLIEFLVANNVWYKIAGVSFSEGNLDDLYPEVENSVVEAVPIAVEICQLDSDQGADATTANYTAQRDMHPDIMDGTELTLTTNPAMDPLVMDAIGYTSGDYTPRNLKVMKAKALARVIDGGQFLKMQSGSHFINNQDPGLLTYLFSNLDPWGIGGFNEPNRRPNQRISFERQVRNLLRQHESPFQKDPHFAYVCWNIIQKAEVNKNTSFTITQRERNSILDKMQSVGPLLTNMIAAWERNPNTQPSNWQQKQALKLLQCLKHAAKDLKGSFGYKLCRRNEIHSLIKHFCTPALFLMSNPADIFNPLLGVVAGLTPEQWADMTAFERGIFVANNPGPAAIFFDTLIKVFLSIVIRYGRGAGLFGTCLAHYGVVEAQGRGSLHCHMLLWLKGNPAPQDLRDHMSAGDGFKTLMFTWLESIIHSHLPGEEVLHTETPGEALHRPPRDAHVADPCLNDEPKSVNMTNEDFALAFRQTVRDLAIECNWHEHTDTCWKHLKPGEPRDDQHCRMWIDGSTRALTDLDEETQSILLRCLHPRINNFTDLMLFLFCCNMDIKFIGSREAAKALVYYVTDYIMKSSLATHVGLAAVLYAIQQNNKKFQGLQPAASTVNKSLFTKTVNTIMARQELSHQQVMGYLVGGSDHYTSHKFKMIKWQQSDKYIVNHFNASVQDDISSHSVQLEDDGNLTEPENELDVDNNVD